MLGTRVYILTLQVVSAAISRATLACRPTGFIAVTAKLVSSEQRVRISGEKRMHACTESQALCAHADRIVVSANTLTIWGAVADTGRAVSGAQEVLPIVGVSKG